MNEKELTADEIQTIREAIKQALIDDFDADVVVIDNEFEFYQVYFTTPQSWNTNKNRFETEVKCCSGSRESFDPETGKSIDYYRFSKYELSKLNFDC